MFQQTRDHISKLVDLNYSLYEAMGKSQGMPDAVTDWIYRNAMSPVLFDLHQQQNHIGIIGTMSGKIDEF